MVGLQYWTVLQVVKSLKLIRVEPEATRGNVSIDKAFNKNLITF